MQELDLGQFFRLSAAQQCSRCTHNGFGSIYFGFLVDVQLKRLLNEWFSRQTMLNLQFRAWKSNPISAFIIELW